MQMIKIANGVFWSVLLFFMLYFVLKRDKRTKQLNKKQLLARVFGIWAFAVILIFLGEYFHVGEIVKSKMNGN